MMFIIWLHFIFNLTKAKNQIKIEKIRQHLLLEKVNIIKEFEKQTKVKEPFKVFNKIFSFSLL